MIGVDDALRAILERVRPAAPVSAPLPEAVGLALAEQVLSDVDSPPHDKAMVDGYAAVASDLQAGNAELIVREEVTAGMVPTHEVQRGSATRIMTGAPLPRGADVVAMVEHTECWSDSEGRSVVRISDQLAAGANIMRQGTALRRGQTVLAAGHVIRAIDVGVLGEVGAWHVPVYPPPRVAVLATGNELVSPDERPGPGQIRNSNGPMLAAQVTRAGGAPQHLGIARDRRDDLAQLIHRGLEADILLLSGGVSAGLLDLVPAVLESLGVAQVFHKVKLKPGKPLWFGTLASSGPDKLVFGLPGNPVSSLVCFELFVRPAIQRLSGREASWPKETAELAEAHIQRGERPTFHPAVQFPQGSLSRVRALDWKGSADLKTLADANCLICFPAGDHHFQAGDSVEIVRL